MKKLATWIDKSKETTHEAMASDLPMLSGMEKIKIQRCQITKREMTKIPNGSMHVKDLGNVKFGHSKTGKPAERRHSESSYTDYEEQDDSRLVTEVSEVPVSIWGKVDREALDQVT